MRDPGAREVRVRIAACAICASDLHVWRTGQGIGFPAVLGHEASGVVEAVGTDVTDVSKGQGVVLAWIPRCATCRACRAGRTHLCAAMRTNADDGSLSPGGRALGRYMSISGLSELVVVGELRRVGPRPGRATAGRIRVGIVTGLRAISMNVMGIDLVRSRHWHFARTPARLLGDMNGPPGSEVVSCLEKEWRDCCGPDFGLTRGWNVLAGRGRCPSAWTTCTFARARSDPAGSSARVRRSRCPPLRPQRHRCGPSISATGTGRMTGMLRRIHSGAELPDNNEVNT